MHAEAATKTLITLLYAAALLDYMLSNEKTNVFFHCILNTIRQTVINFIS